ncbi:FAD-dependent oxidoreductase [Anaerobacillus isosaccharinicus]|uniref:FAD-dependent oxidoreductase n=1 Tax=Anaerobacillus isosaccharinicus TaxID=1532552 RepID=A0A7S7LA39_9BACI|nr:FAD-dependent oxidoreductase [Anaerobacillus isosaccharinicus]MBA5584477.1 FAD-dependent oxidoreductase [Anaerobacillus isosaccharinicus]QOY37137.1 FAD-dependent oxidoreductase [Anaerobacillus isosaccharinicus]
MIKQEMAADIVIIGGSTGGCAAALAAAKSGCRVIMTEETKWIGGQLTNQAVPPDEHRWIEKVGCTRSYRKFRDNVRKYYRENFPLTAEARNAPYFNPGNAIVSRICHEPRAALAVLNDMLAPYVHSGKVVIMTETKLVNVETNGDDVLAVEVEQKHSLHRSVLTAPYFLDATDSGDVLPLAGVEYVTGAESQKETGEPHALVGKADPMDMQAFTQCFAIDYIEGGDFTIPKPKNYQFWRNYQASFWPNKQLDWTGVNPVTLEPITYGLFNEENKFSLWEYRRVIDKFNFEEGLYAGDLSIINWPQNDYWLGPIIDVSEEEKQKHLDEAKQLSLSLLYWMQTEAPRPDGKEGYPGLRLRPDVVGTDDGLAMFPYIRESRRVKAEFTVVEQQISTAVRGTHGAELFHDSVGIGSYRIDLHPSTGLRTFVDISSLPFQIPLGSLIPIRVNNLLPASKNLGVTHITNGCYRLHPVEWNIGEVSGYLAAYCLKNNLEPRQVRNTQTLLVDFQTHLVNEGVELAWLSTHAV